MVAAATSPFGSAEATEAVSKRAPSAISMGETPAAESHDYSPFLERIMGRVLGASRRGRAGSDAKAPPLFRQGLENLERNTPFEPATLALARRRSSPNEIRRKSRPPSRLNPH